MCWHRLFAPVVSLMLTHHGYARNSLVCPGRKMNMQTQPALVEKKREMRECVVRMEMVVGEGTGVVGV